ncbi:MAG: hypothetical protein QNK27_14310 [Desulfuromusa sp.]|nr:hypothetical protein [Desulfuromusa sp.]
MKKLFLLSLIGFIFVIPIGDADAGITSSICLNKTINESQCKNCCDCMDVDAARRRSCRNSCAEHDFSLNADFITVDAPSKLGPDGDYSGALGAGNEQACKEYCDASGDLACGDRHYCRDACNAAGFTNSAPDKSQKSDNRGLPPEIVSACQGKSEQATCQVGETFTGTCQPLLNDLACVLIKQEAPTALKQQWEHLDRNRDGFLDVNEARGDATPKKQFVVRAINLSP